MTISPTIAFSFVPTCKKFSCCCCCDNSDDDSHAYPTKSGKFQLQGSMSSKEIKKANKRLEQIIRRKLEPLPLDTDEFMRRLVEEEGIDLTVSQHYPLTKERVEEITIKINQILSELTI